MIFLSHGWAKKKSVEENSSGAVKLALPERKGYFASIDAVTLTHVENGSPESLRTAIVQLKRNRDRMTEVENVLHYIAVSIMEMCWKSQSFSESSEGQYVKNNYTGAISSSKNGFYDPSSDPQDFLSYVLPSLVLAVSNTRNDYYSQAESDLAKALSIKPDSLLATYLSGLLYSRMGDFKRAEDFFNKAFRMCPNCYECAYSLADVYMKLAEYKKAFDFSEKLLITYTQNKELLKLCAESAFAMGDSTNAEVYVGKVLQLEPENSYYLLFRARILVKKGEYIRAASLLDAYSRRDSQSRDYLLLRFEVQKNWNKNISAATSTIEKALTLYPDDREIILEAALLSSETGVAITGKKGEELAEKILSNEPDNMEALKIKIASLMAEKKWTEAYRESSSLIKKEGVPDSVYFNHIKICLAAGKKDEAWLYASRLYEEKSADEEILQIYIDVLVSTGRGAEASRLIGQLLQNSGTKMKSFLYYERSFLSKGESAILSDLRSSLTANPRNKDSLFRLYQIYFDKKEYRKAQYYLKQVVALSPQDEYLLNLNKNLEKLLKN